MNDLIRIPCALMRGGTSKGPFFLASDLPSDPAFRDQILLSVMGSGHPLQIDGIGGGNPVTSKVAIVGPASIKGADVDYLFAQVRVDQQIVDMSPNCGNMLAAVGPFAIEAGLVPVQGPTTLIRIHNVNTGKLIEAEVPTPNGSVSYLGDAAIDGVPGSAAPIALTFMDAAGARTGQLFPTGKPNEVIDGVNVTCIDCAIPMILLEAEAIGVSGFETAAELNGNKALLERLERLRIAAGERMGMGDVSNQVTPKPVLISRPRADGDINVRYFMPHQCHPSLATTGAVGIATACISENTVASRLIGTRKPPVVLSIEHPSGHLDVKLQDRNGKIVAGILRTARRLFEGHVFAKPVAQFVCAA
ncbi:MULTISPECIES: 4-oxalomesaconate tautomerase [unclassified Mesorhizobium]|uniref:4-oxalomesaconate tautomerase n=3 Tax=Mesorhizobium TaxID=68287 RepID=UPI000FCC62B7|nr:MULTISPECIES: 4-oxalomesaconate tautomerase [unclassified Mesorhizobium]RUV67676.1 4-oxalomesaconate tautomerase [Mesorhizobium sp. M5C.F.Cr.IN.023.01.1.1]RWE94172.1 MAG: 4-oxalomesaconate tautomerase [Mesorhizobium sp.]RWJ06628.1 MAG: 4-oxalomesaconate tautomerase [Mesorhizobium sp.]RWJ11140.1 MAG: 4-oxalomesaconate tautomerase [Mesorhizobium sp.]RWJ61334.1 MAG: 4-oxalomesaconate tautomerase [Mesorhizobium sp.]